MIAVPSNIVSFESVLPSLSYISTGNSQLVTRVLLFHLLRVRYSEVKNKKLLKKLLELKKPVI